MRQVSGTKCSPQPHTFCSQSCYWGLIWILLLSAMFFSNLDVKCRDERVYAMLTELFAMGSFRLMEVDAMLGMEMCDPGWPSSQLAWCPLPPCRQSAQLPSWKNHDLLPWKKKGCDRQLPFKPGLWEWFLTSWSSKYRWTYSHACRWMHHNSVLLWAQLLKWGESDGYSTPYIKVTSLLELFPLHFVHVPAVTR